MTPEHIEHHYLSLRVWVMRIVAPTACAVLIILFLCRGLDDIVLRDHTAVLVAFAALYYCLLRGGHMIMIRSLHIDLLKKHETAYREKLSALSPDHMRRNIGFTLSRIKRDILDQAK